MLEDLAERACAERLEPREPRPGNLSRDGVWDGHVGVHDSAIQHRKLALASFPGEVFDCLIDRARALEGPFLQDNQDALGVVVAWRAELRALERALDLGHRL